MTKNDRIPRKRKGRLQRRRTLVALSFIAPNFIGFMVFTLIPVLAAVFMSMTEWSGGDFSKIKWVGFDNFVNLFTVPQRYIKRLDDPNFWNILKLFFEKVDIGIALKNTVTYTAITVPLTLVSSMALALALNKAVKGAVAFRGIMFFPYVSSTVAICVCWNFMMMKNGPVNQLLMFFGSTFNKTWTADSTMAMWAVIIVGVWRSMGYYMVIYLAALQGVPRELYEAATVDGANKWQQFTHVTLPQLRPTTFFVSVMLMIGCFKVYDTVAIMTNGGGPGRATKMLVTYTIDKFNEYNYGTACAIAMVLLVLVLSVTIIQFRMEKKFSAD